jgi:hypothetical protein
MRRLTRLASAGLTLALLGSLALPTQVHYQAQTNPEPIYLPLLSTWDPLAYHLGNVDFSRLEDFTYDLVSLYGPRHYQYFRTYQDDRCTLGGPSHGNSNLVRAANYAKDTFEMLGYRVYKEAVADGSGGFNVVAEKPGMIYPNQFIELGAHIDTKEKTPGASDNAAGVAAVLELARVLADYDSRYSLRFIAFIGEEYGRTGSKRHVSLAKTDGEQVKAGLVLDGIGWSEISPAHMNCNWADHDPESQRIASLFDLARQEYAIDIAWRMCSTTTQTSDNVSYWEAGYPAVLSIGGLPYADPEYHACNDTLPLTDMHNAFKTAQQNLLVLLMLDSES